VQGQESAVYCREEFCLQRLIENDMSIQKESSGSFYCIERYACPRFTTPDENGQIILDIVFFVEQQQ